MKTFSSAFPLPLRNGEGTDGSKIYSAARLASFSVLVVATIIAFPHSSLADEPKQLEAGFSWLFDGKSFEGWEGNRDYFRLEQGAIVAGSLTKKIPHNEFLCTKKAYRNFELRAEVKLIGEGKNAGIQFRSQRVPNHHEVSGYQCDVGDATNGSIWGALYDESRRNKMLAQGPAESLAQWVKQADWNELRIVAEGKRIQLFVNGHKTVDYTEAESEIPETGIVGLQIHAGPPTEAWYRSLRIREL